MTCGMSFIKYLLFIFNLFFAISGLGIIIAGSIVLSDVSDVNNHFADNGLIGPSIVLIVAGVIVFIIAFLGCYGAIKESYTMLITFAVLLIIIFIIEFAVGIAAAVYKLDFQHALNETLTKSMENYSKEPERIAWDNTQRKFKCCGVNGPNDWKHKNPIYPKIYPLSCCHSDQETDRLVSSYCISQNIGEYVYKTGCYERLQTKIHSNGKILIGVGIGIAFIEIVGIMFACWLAYTIKTEGKVV